MGEMVVMDHLNWGYLQLGLVALVFGGLQIWWIGRHDPAYAEHRQWLKERGEALL